MQLNRLRHAEYLLSVEKPGELEECEAEAAFIGRSNVGKSSVLNALCGKKGLAKTSQTAGRTRTINAFGVAARKRIIDLPGYGYAAGPAADLVKFKHMIKGYLMERPSLRLTVLLVDAYVGATKLDVDMALWLQKNDIPFTAAANKCDRVGGSKMYTQRQEIAGQLGITMEDLRWISAEKGTGIAALANEVADALQLV